MQPSPFKALQPWLSSRATRSILDGCTHVHREQGRESSVCKVTVCVLQELATEEPCSRLSPGDAAMREGSVDKLAQLGPGTKAELPGAVSPR